MIQQKYSPELFETGILTPCIKKDKDALLTDNHRYIVVTPLLSKLLERVVANKENPTATQKQNCLQFGFNEGISPTITALLVTKVTAEHKDKGLPTYIVALSTTELYSSAIPLKLKWQTCLIEQLNCTRCRLGKHLVYKELQDSPQPGPALCHRS